MKGYTAFHTAFEYLSKFLDEEEALTISINVLAVYIGAREAFIAVRWNKCNTKICRDIVSTLVYVGLRGYVARGYGILFATHKQEVDYLALRLPHIPYVRALLGYPDWSGGDEEYAVWELSAETDDIELTPFMKFESDIGVPDWGESVAKSILRQLENTKFYVKVDGEKQNIRVQMDKKVKTKTKKVSKSAQRPLESDVFWTLWRNMILDKVPPPIALKASASAWAVATGMIDSYPATDPPNEDVDRAIRDTGLKARTAKNGVQWTLPGNRKYFKPPCGKINGDYFTYTVYVIMERSDLIEVRHELKAQKPSGLGGFKDTKDESVDWEKIYEEIKKGRYKPVFSGKPQHWTKEPHYDKPFPYDIVPTVPRYPIKVGKLVTTTTKVPPLIVDIVSYRCKLHTEKNAKPIKEITNDLNWEAEKRELNNTIKFYYTIELTLSLDAILKLLTDARDMWEYAATYSWDFKKAIIGTIHIISPVWAQEAAGKKETDLMGILQMDRQEARRCLIAIVLLGIMISTGDIEGEDYRLWMDGIAGISRGQRYRAGGEYVVPDKLKIYNKKKDKTIASFIAIALRNIENPDKYIQRLVPLISY